MGPESVTDVTTGDVVIVIPAWNEEDRIAATVRAASQVAPVLVVDDGSRDSTARLAREAGARVIAQPRRRGKGAAMASGLAAVPAMTRYVLFLDADLEDSAASVAPLLDAVRSGASDMAIAVPPPQPGGGHGFVVRLARDGIRKLTGFEAAAPLSGQRCLTVAAARAGLPYASRFGVEVGLTIDLLRAGYRVAEVPADVRHRVTGTDWRAQLHRARQYRDVWLVLRSERSGRSGRSGRFGSRFRSRSRRLRSR